MSKVSPLFSLGLALSGASALAPAAAAQCASGSVRQVETHFRAVDCSPPTFPSQAIDMPPWDPALHPAGSELVGGQFG